MLQIKGIGDWKAFHDLLDHGSKCLQDSGFNSLSRTICHMWHIMTIGVHPCIRSSLGTRPRTLDGRSCCEIKRNGTACEPGFTPPKGDGGRAARSLRTGRIPPLDRGLLNPDRPCGRHDLHFAVGRSASPVGRTAQPRRMTAPRDGARLPCGQVFRYFGETGAGAPGCSSLPLRNPYFLKRCSSTSRRGLSAAPMTGLPMRA